MSDENASNSFDKFLSLKLTPLSSHLMRAEVSVNPSLVKPIRTQTLNLYQKNIVQVGFKNSKVPYSYIEKHYHKEIYTSIKGFLFTHYVLNYLFSELINKKILVANLPRLKKISVDSNLTAHYAFDLSTASELKLKEWKHFVFKAPKRKNYKDLDKQVTLFMKREQSDYKKLSSDVVQEDDWISLDATLLGTDHKPIQPVLKNSYWMKVSTRHVARPLASALLGKKVGDTFITDDFHLEESFQEKVNNKYSYQIHIKAISKGNHLSIESFKANYRLKSKADVHKKLIEVFSYRNDLSQRRSIIEEVFHLLFSKHRFEVPKHIVLRKQENILISLRRQPDYHVYKMQKDFLHHVELLAEKQLKEEVLMDQIAYNENITVDERDIQHYLNLFNNERLKEFVYFRPPLGKIEESVSPLHPSLLKQAALREKTLNHVIHVLTK